MAHNQSLEDEVRDFAMLDASMLAHRVSCTRIRALAKQRPHELQRLVVSDALLRLVTSPSSQQDENFLMSLFTREFQVPRRMLDLGSMRELLQNNLFREQVIPYRRVSFTEIPPMYRALLETTSNEWVTQIIYEEWEYLMSHSWLFSKTRAVYDHLIDAGSEALYVTRRKLERAMLATKSAAKGAGKLIVEGSDAVARKTIKKPAGQRISPNDRVRALAKWVAVGGSAATSMMVPIAGTVTGVVTGLFLLYDP